MRIFVAALVALGLAQGARAQDATIKAALGGLELLPEGSKKPLAAGAGDTLIAGDTLRTKKGSLAHVELADGAVVLMKPETTMRLFGDSNDTVVEFPLGEFLIGLAKKLARGSSFRARTPAAVAAVRGTLFWGRTSSDKKTVFAAVGHSIDVTAQGQTLTLQPGQSATIEYGLEPAAPTDAGVTKDFLKTFAVGGSIQGLDALADKRVH